MALAAVGRKESLIRRRAALAACAVIAIAVFFASDPNARLRSALAAHDFGHVIAFGLATALFAVALDAWSGTTFRRRAGTIWMAAGAALALGTAVEAAQAASGGTGDPWDVVRDGGGAFSAALIMNALDPVITTRMRVILASVVLLSLAALAYPVVAALEDEARARAQFPLLAGFETGKELSRFQFGEGIRPGIVLAPDEQGRPVRAMQLPLPPGRYPGFELSHFPGDWRGMRALELLIVNPEATPFEITVRIDDADYDHKLDIADRYNRAFPLSPGANRIEIPLSEVAAAPRNRRLDLGRVQSLLVYAVDLDRPRSIIIGPIVLVR